MGSERWGKVEGDDERGRRIREETEGCGGCRMERGGADSRW